MKRLLLVVPVVAIATYLAWPFAFTSVPIAGAKVQGFDPVAYVDGVWDRINSTINEKAVGLTELLTAIHPDGSGTVSKQDLIEGTKKYGLITVGEAHVYMIKGTGTVSSVDAKTSLGTALVQLDGYTGPIKVRVYVGTRIPSDESSVRDAVGFITFGDFKEQTEYGKVSAEINRRAADGLASVDKSTLDGKKIAFVGTMTIRTFNLVTIDVGQLDIVPISIELR